VSQQRVEVLPYAGFDVVVIAASQGGWHVARTLFARLPPDFPAAVLYTAHRAPDAADVVVGLMARICALPVSPAVPTEPLTGGTVVVAPSAWQLVLDPDARQRREEGPIGRHGSRADPLLASLARVHGRRVLAVILSGRLGDGAAGIAQVAGHGGRVLVQDPATAEYPSMPEHAVATGLVDLELDPETLAAAIVALVMVPGARDRLGAPAAVRARSAG
jgi:two-component system chemotaxis response regulator CheB